VLHLRLEASVSESEPIGRRLESAPGVKRVLAAQTPDGRLVVLSADVEPGSADHLLEILGDLEIEAASYVLTRLDVVAPISTLRMQRSAPGGFAWLEVLGEARASSRPLARYLAMMSVAAIIAALGVIESNSVLIVGAMAVSPDLLPICALSVGVVGRRWPLVGRSAATLVIGVALVATVGALLAFALSAAGLLASDFNVRQSSIGALAAHTDYSTVLVALAAGIAAMLSFETRASAAVGVAISVTTIPASAYLGVSVGLGEISEGLGALAVLAINIALLIVSGTATLFTQRLVAARAATRASDGA